MMKNSRHIFIPVLIMLLLAPAINARAVVKEAPEEELDHPISLDSGTLKEVLGPDMIMLDDDRRFRLDNILIPPLEYTAAVDEMNHAFLNKQVTAYSYHDDKNKHGVPVVQIITDNNEWLQEDLVSKGLAWAYSTDSSQQMAHALKVVEDSARLQQQGFWKDPAYAIKTPQTIKKYLNTYQIVEGKILSVYSKPYSGTTFLNFGKNWKTDFEVRVMGDNRFLSFVKDPKGHNKKDSPSAIKDAKQDAKAAKEYENDVKDYASREEEREDSRENTHHEAAKSDDPDAFDASQWENRFVRVRGWVRPTSTGAPVIDITEKEQIDFVDDK